MSSDDIAGPSIKPSGATGLFASHALQRSVSLLLALAGTPLIWLGGPGSLAGALLIAGGTAWATQGWLRGRAGPRAQQPTAATPVAHNNAATAPRAPRAPAAAGHANPMVSEVVPVWSRQIEITREKVDTSLAQILTTFSDMSTSLDALSGALQGISTAAQPGAIDSALEASREPLEILQASAQRAFDQRNQAVAELSTCTVYLDELTILARQAHELGRHTRLVAFNASIEASREGGCRDGGTQSVAEELRRLSVRIGETTTAMQRNVAAMAERMTTLRNTAVAQETSTEELRLEIDLRAREALQSLLAAVGASLSGSSTVREASAALRQQLDDGFVHFQFGDRVSQMLAIVGNDMNNFVDWVGRHPAATVDDAVEWLQRLEASYTMEEQRSEHHGNVHVDRGSEVEFF